MKKLSAEMQKMKDWYPTTFAQMEKEREEEEWIKNNPNASAAEILYPSMRKPKAKSTLDIQNNGFMEASIAINKLKPWKYKDDESKYLTPAIEYRQTPEEIEEEWIRNNPNASVAELFYPSMRKKEHEYHPYDEVIVPDAFLAGDEMEKEAAKKGNFYLRTLLTDDFEDLDLLSQPFSKEKDKSKERSSQNNILQPIEDKSLRKSPVILLSASSAQAGTSSPASASEPSSNSPNANLQSGNRMQSGQGNPRAQENEEGQDDQNNKEISSYETDTYRVKKKEEEEFRDYSKRMAMERSKLRSTNFKEWGTLGTTERSQENVAEIKSSVGQEALTRAMAEPPFVSYLGNTENLEANVGYFKHLLDKDNKVLTGDNNDIIRGMATTYPEITQQDPARIDKTMESINRQKALGENTEYYMVGTRILKGGTFKEGHKILETGDYNLMPSHQQLVRSDGTDFGYSDKGITSDPYIEDIVESKEFEGVKLNKIYIEAARDLLSEEYTGENYQVIIQNCQDFVEDTIKLAEELASLYGESVFMDS